jgi:peptidoglycan-N-acetylglucosamine deacetylase
MMVRLLSSIVAIAASMGLLAVPAAGVPAHARDGSEPMPRLELASAELRQDQRVLVLTASTADEWGPADLAPAAEGSMCLELAWGGWGPRRRACLRPAESGGLRVRLAELGPEAQVVSRRWIRPAIRRPGRSSFQMRVGVEDIGAPAGRLRWRLRTSWIQPECMPGTAPCVDALPDRGWYTLVVRATRVVGCTTGGPSIRRNGARTQRRVALTFDDGPGAMTATMLQTLADAQARATFFVLGSQIAGNEHLLRRAAREGHEIGNHSWSHGMPCPLCELARTSRHIRRVSGFRPCSFRPPGGYLSSTVTRAAREAGMHTILWDVDPQDWRRPGVQAIVSNVVRNVRNGSIVIMHDGGGDRRQTAAALPSIIARLQDRGYRLVPVYEVLGHRPLWGYVR